MTWGIFTSVIESPLCNNCTASARRSVDLEEVDLEEVDLEEVDLEEVAQLGFQWTGVYLSPQSILSPVKWAQLAYRALHGRERLGDMS